MSYVMIDSEKVWIEQYYRTAQSTSWQVDAPLEEITTSLRIEALHISLPLATLYEGLGFNEDEEVAFQKVGADPCICPILWVHTGMHPYHRPAFLR